MNATKADATGLLLVLNCGSSSIKFAVFDARRTPMPRRPLWSGKVDGITGPSPSFGEIGSEPVPIALDPSAPNHTALEHINERVTARLNGRRLAAVAHRVGAWRQQVFRSQSWSMPPCLADLKRPISLCHTCTSHLHCTLRIRICRIVCFETAFHRTMPVGY